MQEKRENDKCLQKKEGSVRGFSMGPGSACSVFTTNSRNLTRFLEGGGYRPVPVQALMSEPG